MPAGTIIGRISVKVLPDTDDFRRDAKKKLDAIEKGLEVQSRVELDATGLKGQAEAARAKAQAQMRDLTLQVNLDNQQSLMRAIRQVQGELDKLDNTELKVGLNRDDLKAATDLLKEHLDEVATLDLKIDKRSQAGLESAILKINQQLNEMEKIDFSVKLDRASLIKARDDIQAELEQKIQIQAEIDRKQIADMRRRVMDQLRQIPINTKLDEGSVKKVLRQIEGYLEQIEDLKATITPELDERAKLRVERQIDDIKDKIDGLRAQIKPDVSPPFWANAWKTLALLARDRFVHIYTKINEASLATAVAAINRLSGARVATNLVKNLGESLGNLDRTAPKIASVAAGITALGGAATNAVGSVLSLAGSLISMAPAALALPGIFAGMALGVSATVIAFKDLPRVLPEIQQGWTALKATVSDNFWEQAKAPLREMVQTLLPQFSAGMAKVGTEVGGFFAKFSESLTGALDGRLEGMFANLTESINIAGTSTDSLANIIAILGDLGSQYLPQLAQWFVDITQKFENFLTRASESGELKTWVDNGITAFTQLGSVLKSIGSIFLSLAEAATLGGGGTLGTLAATLAHVAEVAKDPVFQGKLAEFFRSTREAMDQIGQISGPAMEKYFDSLLTTFSNVLPTAAVAIGLALDGIATALADPAFSDGVLLLFDGLKVGIAALAPVVAQLGPVLGMIAHVTGLLLAALGPVIAAVVSALMPALQSLLPVLTPIITILGTALTQIVTELAPVLTTIARLFAQLLAAVVPLLEPLIQLLMAILTPLLAVIQQVISAAMPPLIAAFTQLTTALQPVIEILTVVVDFLMATLAPAIQFLAGAIMNGLIIAIEAIAQVFQGVVDIVMGVWNTFSALFRDDWEGVWNGIKQVWSGVWDAIVGLFKLVAAQFLGHWRAWGNALGETWSAVWNTIRSFFSSIWNSIMSWFSNQLNTMRSNWTATLSVIGTIWDNCWSTVLSYLRAAWQNIQTVIRGGVDTIISTVKQLPGKITSALGNLGNLLVKAGKQLIEGFIRGIKNMFGSVQSTLGGLTSKLTDWKGPESLDKALLVRAGQLVVGGFIKGLESRYDEVRRSLAGLTSDIGDMAIEGPSVNGAAASSLAAKLSAAMGDVSTEGPVIKQFVYNAAPNQSLDAEEDLFRAVGRARWGW